MTDKLQPWALGAPCYACGKVTSIEDHSIRHGRAIHESCWIAWARSNPHILTAVDKFMLEMSNGAVDIEDLVQLGVAKRVM